MKIGNILISLGFALIFFSSCDKKSEKNVPDNGGNSIEQELPSNGNLLPYRFFRDGVSSVDIGESTHLINEFRLFNLAVNSGRLTNLKDAKNRFDNTLLPQCCRLTDASQASKYKELMSSLMSQLNVLSEGNNSDRRASKGQAGFIEVDQTTKRILDSKGQQIGQILQKALMGSMQLDKINIYLTKAVDSNLNDAIIDGKNYTMREHYWDIAYGFVGRNDIDKKRYEPLFLANYIEKETVGMAGLENLTIKIYQAFYKGREAAITANINIMKEQKKIILSNINNMMKLRTIFYLNECLSIINKTKGSVEANYFHNMGEALGFVLALPFVHDESGSSIISVEDAIGIYNSLLSGEDGVWDTNRLSGTRDGSIFNAIEKISKL